MKNISLEYLNVRRVSNNCEKFTMDLQNLNLVLEDKTFLAFNLALVIIISVSSLIFLLSVLLCLVNYGYKRRRQVVLRPISKYKVTRRDMETEGETVN